MTQFYKKSLTFLGIYFSTFCLQSAPIESNLPPILDYYPSCEYSIITIADVKQKTLDPNNPVVIANLLEELQVKAKAENADALILIAKNLKIKKSFKRTTSDANTEKYQVKFKAELIKLCKDVAGKDKKLAKFNHLGQMVNLAISQKIKTTYRVEQVKKTINDSKILSNEVSIKNGVYGAKLGETYQAVVNNLGIPSAKINLLKDELIIGYGRRHWFHFQLNKLVKIQTTNSLLSQSALNRIPLVDFFDDDVWKINNRVAINTTLKDAMRLLKIKTPINGNNQLIHQQNGRTLKLNFKYGLSKGLKKAPITLMGFSLQLDDYEAAKKISFEQQKQQLKLIQQMYSQLELKQQVDFENLKSKLGKPVGEINLTKSSVLKIYSPHLTLQIKNSALTKINLIQESLLSSSFTSENTWTLGRYTYGASRKQLQQYFPKNTYETENEVAIENDKYTLSLGFDTRQNISTLIEAEILLWF